MPRILMHPNVGVRAAAAVGLTLLLLGVVWAASHLVLRPGAVRVGWGASLARRSAASAAVQILAFNLLLGAGGIILLNQWRDARGLAIGYYVHLLRSSLLHGLLRGTNSFTFPYPSPAAGFRGFLAVGLWETVGLSLVCASTALLAKYSTRSALGVSGFLAFLRRPAAYLRGGEAALLLGGLVLLALAAVAEALNIARQ
ncbi:MAG: hypothetical protein K6T75_08015 [Acetobacteraceae bacterium]|nr:hypothetical protein [Acetobacteraceae bacterium]